jgi:hypothetical protein
MVRIFAVARDEFDTISVRHILLTSPPERRPRIDNISALEAARERGRFSSEGSDLMSRKTKLHLLDVAGWTLVAGAVAASQVFGIAGMLTGGALALLCFYRAETIKFYVPVSASNPKPYVSPFKVEFDDVEVRVTYEGKPRESVKWAEVVSVAVHIDDSFLPEPWWVLFNSSESGCMYPSSAVGGGEMLEAMQKRLAGFDDAAVVECMGLMEGGRLIWSKQVSAAERAEAPSGTE